MVTDRTDTWVRHHSSGQAVNDLINHIGRVAQALDDDVYDTAIKTSCTELDEYLATLDTRQMMVREMVVIMLQLNSIVPDDESELCTGQPTRYC